MPQPCRGGPSPQQAQLAATIQLLPGFPDVTGLARGGTALSLSLSLHQPRRCGSSYFQRPGVFVQAGEVCTLQPGARPAPGVPLPAQGSWLPEVPSGHWRAGKAE